MHPRTGTGRTALLAVAACAAFGVLTPALSGTAHAASVGGVDLSPVPAVVDGRPVTSFRTDLPEDGTRTVQYAVRNTSGEPRTVRVYAVGARRSDSGSFSLTDRPSPWVELPEQTLDLTAEEARVQTFAVRTDGRDLPAGEQYAAVVLEVSTGSVVQRVATIVYLRPDPALPVPVLLAIGAGVLATVVGGTVVLARRRTV